MNEYPYFFISRLKIKEVKNFVSARPVGLYLEILKEKKFDDTVVCS